MISQHVHSRDLARLLGQEFRGPNAAVAEVLIELHLEECAECRRAFEALKTQFKEFTEDRALERVA